MTEVDLWMTLRVNCLVITKQMLLFLSSMMKPGDQQTKWHYKAIWICKWTKSRWASSQIQEKNRRLNWLRNLASQIPWNLGRNLHMRLNPGRVKQIHSCPMQKAVIRATRSRKTRLMRRMLRPNGEGMRARAPAVSETAMRHLVKRLQMLAVIPKV